MMGALIEANVFVPNKSHTVPYDPAKVTWLQVTKAYLLSLNQDDSQKVWVYKTTPPKTTLNKAGKSEHRSSGFSCI